MSTVAFYADMTDIFIAAREESGGFAFVAAIEPQYSAPCAPSPVHPAEDAKEEVARDATNASICQQCLMISSVAIRGQCTFCSKLREFEVLRSQSVISKIEDYRTPHPASQARDLVTFRRLRSKALRLVGRREGRARPRAR